MHVQRSGNSVAYLLAKGFPIRVYGWMKIAPCVFSYYSVPLSVCSLIGGFLVAI